MLFCEVSWYGSGLPNIFHINKKVTKPPLQPLPLYYPVLHLYLCWLLVVNFFDEHCRKLPSILLQLPTLPTLSIHCPLPQKALSAPLFFSSLPGALLCAHTSLALPFPPLRILGPTMGTTGHPTIQHYLYDGVSVKYY